MLLQKAQGEVCGSVTPASALLFTWLSSLCSCVIPWHSLSAFRFLFLFFFPYEDSDPIGLGPILMTSCELDSTWDTMLSDKVTFTGNRVKTSKYNLGGTQLNLKQCPFFSQAPFSFPGLKFSHRIVICSFFSTSILPIKNTISDGLLCIKHCGELMFHADDREPALVNLLVEGERNNPSQ